MAEIKDKVVTVESLKTLHDYNKENYMTKVDPTGTGSLSINRKANSEVGNYSVSIGFDSEASGYRSYAEGSGSIASADYAHVEGQRTIATSKNQHVQGKFNIADEDERYAHIIGNGENINNRSNAHTVTWEGDAWYAGDISADGNIILTSNQYGDKFPTDPIDEGGKGEPHIAGRIFFKRLVE